MLRLLLVTIAGAVVASGQTKEAPARTEFEVASIKPSASLSEMAYVQAIPGTLRMQNMAPRALILLAYGMDGYQISGGPSWMASEHYDIEARAEGNPTVQQMEGPMLQALLADRFKLAVHREVKQGPAYELRLVNGTGKLPPSTAGDCIPYRADAPPPLAPGPGQPRPFFCDYPRYGAEGRSRTLDGKGITMGALAKTLGRAELHRPVIDRTGLTGTYDVHLEWTADLPNATGTEPSDVLSIFTALREQLGLKVDSGRADSEIIVVDRLEKPSGN